MSAQRRKLEGNEEVKNIEGFGSATNYYCAGEYCVNSKGLILIGRYTIQGENGFSVVEVVKCFSCGEIYEFESGYMAR